jgi:U3 small nucleolar RNA-associated protein 24
MGKAKKTRKFAAVKRMIKPNDPRLKANIDKKQKKKGKEKKIIDGRMIRKV